MDFEEIINGWIDKALSTDSVLHNVDHHFNITYSLYMKILTVIVNWGLNIQHTMTKVLQLLYPTINLPSSISHLTRKVKKFKGDKDTTINGIGPKIQEQYIGDSCKAARLKTSYLNDSSHTFKVDPVFLINGLVYELERYCRSQCLLNQHAFGMDK